MCVGEYRALTENYKRALVGKTTHSFDALSLGIDMSLYTSRNNLVFYVLGVLEQANDNKKDTDPLVVPRGIDPGKVEHFLSYHLQKPIL